MSFLTRLATTLAIALLAPAVQAAVQAAAQASTAEPVGGAASLLKVLVVLILLIGMIFAAAWFMRRFGVSGASRATGLLRPLDILQLGARERIVLLAVGEQRVLLGISSNQISALGQFHADAIGELPVETTAPTATVNFSDALRASITKLTGKRDAR